MFKKISLYSEAETENVMTTEIDSPEEWQARLLSQKQERNATKSPAMGMSASELEETLLGDADMLQNMSSGSNTDGFETELIINPVSPEKNLNNSKDSKKRTSSRVSEDGDRRFPVKEEKDSANAFTQDWDEPKVLNKQPLAKPLKKVKAEEVVKKELKKTGEDAVATRDIPVPLTPGQVMVLDEGYLFRPIEIEQRMVEEEKVERKEISTMKEIMTHLTTTPIHEIHHFSILGQHLCDLYRKNQHIDVLVHVDSKVFRAHKIALTCYSKYFSESPDLNSEKIKLPLEVKLKGIPADAFSAFLEFIYSGTLMITPSNLGDMLLISEFLDIQVFKEKCGAYVGKISSDHALVVLESGKVPPSDDAYIRSYESAVEHFTDNYDTESFNKLSLNNLCMILRDDKLKVDSEMDVFWAALKWITYKEKERQKHLSKVMGCVRFPYLSQDEIFSCIESSDLMRDSDICRGMLIKANWIVSAVERKDGDLLNLPKPEQRKCFRRCIEDGSSKCSPRMPNSSSFKDLRSTFSCEVIKPRTPAPPTVPRTPLPEVVLKHVLPTPVTTQRPISPPVKIVKGDILAIGGFTGSLKNQAKRHVEIYNGADNTWRYCADLPKPRHNHAVAMLDGKVYLSGGADPKRSLTRRAPVATNTVFKFDPELLAWTDCAPMNCVRAYHTMCSVYDLLYAIGGVDGDTRATSSIECFDPKSNTWEFFRPMNYARLGASTAVSDGKIYVAGGNGEMVDKKSGGGYLSSTECFNPKSNQWTLLADMQTPRSFASLSVVGNKLYMCGGAHQEEGSLDVTSVGSIEAYNIGDNRWEHKTDMGVPRQHHGAAVLGTKIFLIGGSSVANNKTLKLKSVECLDVKACKWDNMVRDMPSAAKWVKSVALPSK